MTRRSGTLLAVDDNPHNLQLLSGILTEAGYNVRAANSGARALKMMELDAPELVLLDIEMPDVDGFAVCRAMKDDAKLAAIPVIFISALDDLKNKVRGFEEGAVDYIPKPFEALEVLARVGAQLGLVRLRRDLEQKNQQLAKAYAQVERSNQILEGLSYLDPLTGIANRRQFEEIVERELKRAVREQQPLGVAMIDIDHFKMLNDTYGHGAGDDCLRSVAKTMTAELHRPGDIVARYGGEEFVLILPKSDREGAAAAAETLRAAIEARGIPNEGAPRSVVTVSVGVAAMIPPPDMTSADLVARADAALYASKRDGRNRVTVDE
jgi:diguanylate cyclase (GGDEF)-like protein